MSSKDGSEVLSGQMAKLRKHAFSLQMSKKDIYNFNRVMFELSKTVAQCAKEGLTCAIQVVELESGALAIWIGPASQVVVNAEN